MTVTVTVNQLSPNFGQLYCTEFHENPTNSLMVNSVTKGRTDGRTHAVSTPDVHFVFYRTPKIGEAPSNVSMLSRRHCWVRHVKNYRLLVCEIAIRVAPKRRACLPKQTASQTCRPQPNYSSHRLAARSQHRGHCLADRWPARLLLLLFCKVSRWQHCARIRFRKHELHSGWYCSLPGQFPVVGLAVVWCLWFLSATREKF